MLRTIPPPPFPFNEQGGMGPVTYGVLLEFGFGIWANGRKTLLPTPESINNRFLPVQATMAEDGRGLK